MTYPARLRAKLAATLVGAAALLLTATAIAPPPPVTGTVFKDFNGNGIADETPVIGLAGATVELYDDNGLVASAVTNATGAYTLPTAGAVGANVRVELVRQSLPPGWFEGAVPAGGSPSGSDTRLVASATGGTVDFAAIDPSTYCEKNPQFASTCFVGHSAGSPAPYDPTLLSSVIGLDSFKLTGAGLPALWDWNHPEYATTGEVGPIHGLAYERRTENILGAAFYKNAAGWPATPGDNTNPDKIWLIPRNGGAPSVFFSAEAGDDNHVYPATPGTIIDFDAEKAANAPSVARAGWGDIDLNRDGTTLFAVNLFDRLVYSIPVVHSGGSISAGTAATISLAWVMNPATGPLCSNDEWVPGGAEFSAGLLWLTTTCTAFTSQQAADLRVYAFAYDPAAGTFVNALGAPSAAPVVNESLVAGGAFRIGNAFRTWRDVFFGARTNMAWALDIEFTDLDEMVIGINDRYGHIHDVRTQFTSASKGEPMRLVRAPGGAGYIRQEANATDEFFNDDGLFQTNLAFNHESTAGALGFRHGEARLTTNQEDPVDSSIPSNPAAADGTPPPGQDLSKLGANGFTHFDTATGQSVHQTIVYAADDNQRLFGKANGLGDIEYMCELAPTEIGNLVWLDTDRDGIQDPNESGIDGVVVELLGPGGTVLATKTTAQGGLYLFTDADLPGGFVPGVKYALRIDPSQAPLSGLQPTTAAAGRNQADSQAINASGLTTGIVGIIEIGANDHTYDFGYHPPPAEEETPPPPPPVEEVLPPAEAGTGTKLTLRKLGPKTVKAGRNITWRIIVRNTGKHTAKNVRLTDKLPVGVTLVRRSTSNARVLNSRRAYRVALTRYRTARAGRAEGRVSKVGLKQKKKAVVRSLRRYRYMRTGMPYRNAFANGNLSINLGNIPAGKRRVVTIVARVVASRTRPVTNRVEVRASNIARRKASVRTRIIPVRQRVLPAVTG